MFSFQNVFIGSCSVCKGDSHHLLEFFLLPGYRGLKHMNHCCDRRALKVAC